ncbi:GNAT family N-acetyltransferase [Microbulbifer hainanensis]|uniref:GNAT family N-acetyltransferase n=1 Tax=Microbulbifer hainanensis TaxID=2735675 RepID=UPI0018679281|nr:GNAT family N-acetyltransferase [Microbulbifer hainanensis]
MVHWQWGKFSDFSPDQLYEVLRVRQAVFTVEQDCAYQDADGKDQSAWHLTAWRTASPTPEALAYLRVVFPGKKYPEPSIGRVLTAEGARGTGLGRELMRRAVEQIEREYPQSPIRISAQQYLESFYRDFGFVRVSEPYDEDGIPHIEMLRPEPYQS